MNIDQLQRALPEYAKDIKLNLGSVLTETGAPGLTQKQIFSTALGAAYTTKDEKIISAMIQMAKTVLNGTDITAIKSAAVIMAMNNIYYRFTHEMTDKSYESMPANLRMNVMMKHGGDKIDFELATLAASAINGCGKCMNAHGMMLEKAGVSKQAIQSVVRIASVINALALTLQIA